MGWIETWTQLIEVEEPLVSLRHTFRFARDELEPVSDSTLRFRSRDEIEESLDATGFRLREVRDAPDRPGLELVFFARCDAPAAGR